MSEKHRYVTMLVWPNRGIVCIHRTASPIRIGPKNLRGDRLHSKRGTLMTPAHQGSPGAVAEKLITFRRCKAVEESRWRPERDAVVLGRRMLVC